MTNAAFFPPALPRRKAIRLPRLDERGVGHVHLDLEGYFYVGTETINLDINPDNWAVPIIVERDDDPLPEPAERPRRENPEGWKRIRLFETVARDSDEALDFVPRECENPDCECEGTGTDCDFTRWTSGEYENHLLITYHYEATPVPDEDLRGISAHADYEKRIVPTIDGPLVIHIETWNKRP